MLGLGAGSGRVRADGGWGSADFDAGGGDSAHGAMLPVGLGLSARFATTTRFNLRRLTLVAFLTRGVHGPVGAVAATRVEVR